jgi:hypothetical protein
VRSPEAVLLLESKSEVAEGLPPGVSANLLFSKNWSAQKVI